MALEGGQESFWEQKRVVPSGVLACCFVGGWLPFKALFRDGLIGDVFSFCAQFRCNFGGLRFRSTLVRSSWSKPLPQADPEGHSCVHI